MHQEWYETGETDYTLTYFESIRAISFYFTTQREVLFAYLKDLAIGLVFAALGVVSYLSSREKKRKRLAEEAAAKAEAKANFEENRGKNTWRKAKENAKASWEDAILTPKARQEKMQAEREAMKNEAELRLEEANARIEAAREYRKK